MKWLSYISDLDKYFVMKVKVFHSSLYLTIIDRYGFYPGHPFIAHVNPGEKWSTFTFKYYLPIYFK